MDKQTRFTLLEEAEGLRIAQADSVQIVAIDLPRTRNAISRLIAEKLVATLDCAADDKSVHAVVITGTPTLFSAGGDFADMGARALGDWREHFESMARLTRRLASFSKPTVAAVEGWAIGGGMALACCCDKIVAGKEARFAYGFDRMAVLPDVGLLHTLSNRVGIARARAVMMSGETFDADEALCESLVDRVVAAETAEAEAVREAQTAGRSAPLSTAGLKSFMNSGLERALAFEKDCASRLFMSADHAEGLAAFRERRSPVFSGR